MIRTKLWVLSAAAAIALPGACEAGPTLDAVKARGKVECGVSIGLPGFSYADDKGAWRGLDVDVCRALAAAIFGDPEKVNYTPTTVQQRWPLLQSGQVDLLSRNTTWTLTRNTTLGIDYAGINYYEGQTFMVRKATKISRVAELDGSTICVASGSTEENNVGSYFRARNMIVKVLTFEKNDDAVAAFDAGRCDTYTAGTGALLGWKLKLKSPDDAVILKETISNDPQGPVVRNNDPQWTQIVRWSLNATIEAERLGVTSANIDEKRATEKDADIRGLVGTKGDLGKSLGLAPEWSYNIIKSVGNYGESFERNLGKASRFQLDRGLQQIWTKGGLLFSPPFQ